MHLNDIIEKNAKALTMDKSIYNGYLKILEDELLPAMGCTEPISVA